MSGPEVDQLNNLTKQLSHWVDGLGREDASSCSQLIWLEDEAPGAPGAAAASSSSAAGAPTGMFVLLVQVRYQPKMQIFALCQVQNHEGDSLMCQLPAFPCMIQIRIRASRLGGDGQEPWLSLVASSVDVLPSSGLFDPLPRLCRPVDSILMCLATEMVRRNSGKPSTCQTSCGDHVLICQNNQN